MDTIILDESGNFPKDTHWIDLIDDIIESEKKYGRFIIPSKPLILKNLFKISEWDREA